MSALSRELQHFIDFLCSRGQEPPVRSMRILEFPHGDRLDMHGRLRVDRERLLEPYDYQDRFDELLGLGLPWLHVTCFGVLEGSLIVGIEIPIWRDEGAKATPVNFSGAPTGVVDRGWAVDQVLSLE